MMIATLGTKAGCSASPSEGSDTASEPAVTATTAQSVTVIDCQRQAGSCVKAAKSFTDLGACTANFQSCVAQAALDATGQSTLLKDCRAKSDACLKGALTVSDLSACRSVFEACTVDVASTADGALQTAIDAAKDAITKATQVAQGVIEGASTVAGDALGAVAACETKANACLKGVVKTEDVSACQDVFETCVGNAVSLVDEVVGALPIPSPTEVAKDFQGCQTQSTACLKGAITLTDISACKTTLQTCVKNATTVADTAVDDVNKLLPPFIQIPTPSATADCTAAATACLLKFGANPITCATQATQCLAN